ncbi:poly(hydroxyalkanoate) depolymerase family esterase [Agrobacterium vitis]|nr:poly(hydroxyalkanoate) depolymerase family esterase [Agrobacterium vitis]MBE1438587.1 poly(hydroxyalkanoate) depolymerase family esterase [Agrobacterium vitis]
MNVSKSVAALIRKQRDFQQALVDFVDNLDSSPVLPDESIPVLMEKVDFGSNPGSLRMLEYVPPGLKPGAPLVVVLHGCGQSAEDFDCGSGWTKLARQHGFALLYPEQSSSNNAHGCFNWFRPSSVARDRGEVGSIRQMISTMIGAYDLDADAVHVMGLSAGGALATALLAAHPEAFCAGAIVAGLPVGAARDAMNAFGVMANGAVKTSAEWASLVQQASPESGAWPRISIWHGTDDQVVNIRNADALRSQWLAVHGLAEEQASLAKFGQASGRVWHDDKGDIKVEFILLEGLDHGVPIKPGQGQEMPFMLASNIHLPSVLVDSWGLGVKAKKRRVA